MSTLPVKIVGGQLFLPVWKPERVFNLSGIEVNIEDTEVGDTPETGRTYTGVVTVQLWCADTKESPYVCVAEVLLLPGKHRATALAGYVNDFGFEDVVRIPATAQVVVVSDAYGVNVTTSTSTTIDANSKPQIDLKPLGTFL